jgi:hypothetical protein
MVFEVNLTDGQRWTLLLRFAHVYSPNAALSLTVEWLGHLHIHEVPGLNLSGSNLSWVRNFVPRRKSPSRRLGGRAILFSRHHRALYKPGNSKVPLSKVKQFKQRWAALCSLLLGTDRLLTPWQDEERCAPGSN